MKDTNLFKKEYLWPTNITKSSYDKATTVSKDMLKVKETLIATYGGNPWM